MKVVLDTNVLISGVLTPFGNAGAVVRMITSGGLTLCVDARILLEYGEVLRRPRFGLDPGMVDDLMEYIQASAQTHPTRPLASPLPDPDDSPLLEVALASRADCLVTGNLRHYPVRCRAGVAVLSPAEFIEWARTHGTG